MPMADCKRCIYNPVCELWRESECQDACSHLTGGLAECPLYLPLALNVPGFGHVVPSCPYYHDCGDRLYVGKCRKECLDRYHRTLDGKGGAE